MAPDFGGFGIVIASGHAAATGSTLIFFAVMILEIILGLAVFSYAAHSFLTVVVDTAAGCDQVVWPAEPFTDWLWKLWYLGWITVVWLAPVGLLLTFFKFKALQTVLLVFLFFWLAFPIGLLSSLSATTRWVIFRPVMVWYMLLHFPATAVFYVSTELLLAGLAAVLYFAPRFMGWMLLTTVVAVAVAAVLFLYGRLLGRLAWVMNQRKLGWQEELEEIAAEAKVQDPWSLATTPADEAPAPAEQGARGDKPARAVAADPWAVPPPDEDPDYWKKGLPRDVQEAGRYDIQTAEPAAAPAPPAPRPKRARPAGVYAAEPVGPKEYNMEVIVPEVPEKEIKMLARPPEPPPPAWPMVSGVWSFLGYPATLGPLLTVALGLWLMGAVLRFLISF